MATAKTKTINKKNMTMFCRFNNDMQNIGLAKEAAFHTADFYFDPRVELLKNFFLLIYM